MTEPVIRPIEAGDLPGLRRLWLEAFGDPEPMIDAFYRLLPEMGSGLCAAAGAEVVGFSHLITGLALERPGQKRENAGYLYAVAVDPAWRDRGLGGALSRAGFALGKAQGLKLLCLQPADEGLFAWYDKRLGTGCALRRRKELLPAGEAQPCMALSPTDFRFWREQLLRGRPHLVLGDGALRYQHSLLRCFGGGFYLIGDAVAAVDRDGDTLRIPELLCARPEERPALAAALAASLGASRALLCTADPAGEPYLTALPDCLPADTVWDLSFD